jgi:large subunit ribosomal protein L24
MLKLSRSSSKPIRVRRNLVQSPAHRKNTDITRSPLSSSLRIKYGRNSVRVRTGDSVKLMGGEYSGIEGKVQKVYPSQGLVTVEGITREKIAGGTVPVRIHSSNVVVTNLNLEDKWRRRRLEGKE